MTTEGKHLVRTSPRARRRSAVVVALTAALLAACSDNVPETAEPGNPGTESAPDESATRSDPAPSPSSEPGPEDVPEGLEDFYAQELSWAGCGDHECAELTVPMDYAEPEGATIQVALVRVPAEGDRVGSLVVNPGGPGASGVDHAELAELIYGDPVLQAFDIVGFDPRGVARSAPVVCLDDPDMDEFMGADPTPDDAEEAEETRELGRSFARACEERGGDLLGHVSTIEVARDMDVLRAALGEAQLTYHGGSYGTFLGATYAELFPEKVGRFVLDGAVDPTLEGIEGGLGQAEGFQRATEAYVQDCVEAGGCPLGDDVESGLERISQFLAELDENPLPLAEDVVGELTEGWAMWGIVVAMYAEANWPFLTTAFENAFAGDGELMMMLANFYASRDAEGSYDDNGMQAFYVVSCLEATEDEMDEEEALRQFEQASPTWGRHFAGMGKDVCEEWPVRAGETLEQYAAAGAEPILVIGTTRDPATPYEWAESLAAQLESGVLLTYDGDGHTAYGRSNACVDDAVHVYLLDGVVPEEGTTC